uniref:Uncharacterized protein n=1 Tax=Asterionellopsis glacialis TaxID=33640 RepID=A0A7S0KXB4_9STRA
MRMVLSKKNHHVFVQKYPYTYILMTDLGMFRYLPVLVLASVSMSMTEGSNGSTNTAGVGNEMLMGAIIVAINNLGYYLTKSMWKKRMEFFIPSSRIGGSSSSSSKPDISGSTIIEDNMTILSASIVVLDKLVSLLINSYQQRS